MSTYFIYILRCPDTNNVRYVGCTRFPTTREREHCRHAITQPKTPVQVWLKELREQGKKPAFEIVESGQMSWRHEAEWIKMFVARGFDLLNVRHIDRKTAAPSKN